MSLLVYTVGHSTHPIETFIALLKKHAIAAVADVRSSPYSKFNPQFNRESLKEALRGEGISYVFLGKELGARSDDPACYANGKVQYDRLAKTESFRQGIERVKTGAAKLRLALMCAEKEPLECHRTILVARTLVQDGVTVQHILADGGIESHDAAVARLLRGLDVSTVDLFKSPEEAVEDAYRAQGDAIAYKERAEAAAGE